MQKHRYIRYLIILILFQTSLLFSQSDYWYKLYVDNDIKGLEELLNTGKISDSEWADLVKILFIAESEKSLTKLIELFYNTDDAKLQKIILDRVSQYYYAKGFYETASRILNEPVFRDKIFNSRKSEVNYGIQIGAFTSYQNALQLKKRFAERVDKIKIISKNKEGNNFYVVIAGKFANQSEALKLKREFLKKYNIKGIVTQF